MWHIRQKNSPDLFSPIAHTSREKYMLYYWVGKYAFKDRRINKKILPIYVPVYSKWDIVRYSKLWVNAIDVLLWLDHYWQIELKEVLKNNKTLWRFRRNKTKPPTLTALEEKVRLKREKQEQKRLEKAQNEGK